MYRSRLVTDAIVKELEAVGAVVGRGVKPATGAGWQGARSLGTYVSYTVVHAMTGGRVDGSIDGPDDDVSPLYQLSCLGATQQQCEFEADRAHAVMTSARFVIADRRVVRVIVEDFTGALRIDEVPPAEFQSAGRYRLLTTPV